MQGNMRATKNQNGYTIVETLIVLAVTGVMLTATILLVSDQIARYQFKDSVYNVQQQVQGALNDVQTGYFAEIDNANYEASGACGTEYSTSEQGDSGCVYAGKKITIDNNGLMTLTPLALGEVDAKTKPSNEDKLVKLSNYKQEVQLPGYVDYLDTAEVYVLFTFYPTSGGGDRGGAQATETFYKQGNNLLVSSVTNPDNSQIFCIESGSRQAKFIIGAGGANIVEVKNESC